MDSLARVNKTIVSPDLLEEVLTMHSALPAEERTSFEGRAFHLFRFLESKGVGDRRGDLSVAINFRLQALAGLIAQNETSGWSTSPEAAGEPELIHRNLVRCAALEPLIEDENQQAAFEPESFRRRLWSMTKAEGNA